MEITFCELREKDVINIIDGKKLGKTQDLVLTVNGKILGLIVPGDKKFIRTLSKDDRLFIPWSNICKIGNDVLLVELKNDENINERYENDEKRC